MIVFIYYYEVPDLHFKREHFNTSHAKTKEILLKASSCMGGMVKYWGFLLNIYIV